MAENNKDEINADEKQNASTDGAVPSENTQPEQPAAGENSKEETSKTEKSKNENPAENEKENSPAGNKAEDPAKLKGELETLKSQLEQERQKAAISNLLSGYNFSSPRIKASVAEEIEKKNLKLTNGKLEGAAVFMEELKKNEPDIFSPGIFMTKSKSAVPPETSLKDEIFNGFGFEN